ncbi:hypothetical protein LH462_03845 [Laribacter hongkongensis]|uniref:Uncharacterized protein n=1 Tax=Laribacter hongkongensis TaxID=168471 RepID=A0ABD4SV76_9NEIS|nr:hypothetical protein [Laribacter hongkongensis]MCG9027352.1 hypothetical protein [Laribacter hongkongensis]MCG9033251.1 hypothetical protein [Laribacter hongkongensis]MCG9059209.1 hypothetical protein [Laribacter hongkongensis]MCG9085452.1 hypothetical protein [Laribacter hongkongensis]MCG9093342.1 hypothetical protein [Laribacter hongkongensis]
MLDPQEEREKFISLREALFLIANAKGKTAQEAAATLALTLRRSAQWQNLQISEFRDEHGVLSAEHRKNRLFQLLDRLATENLHSRVMDDDDQIPF